MGVGDLAVGKRVKGMAMAFYGRLAAYGAALRDDDAAALEAALSRNLYRKAIPEVAQVAAVATYLRREAASLDGEPVESLMAGRLRFGLAPLPLGGPE
jgi:cytochrome b pre-mRNA-processing protein 3